MTHIVTPMTPKGEIEINVRDARSMNIIRTIKQDNVLTTNGFNRVHQFFSTNSILWFGINGFDSSRDRIYVSNRKTSPNETNPRIAAGGSTPAADTFIPGDTQLLDPTWTEGDPPFVEVRWRFNGPGSGNPRDINTIFLGVGASSTQDTMFAFVALTTTCTQGEFEVLDITYRVRMIEQPLVNNVGASPELGYFLNRKFFQNDLRGDPWLIMGHWSKVPSIPDRYLSPIRWIDSEGTTGHLFDQGRIYRRTFDINHTESSSIGSVFSFLSYGNRGPSHSSDTAGYRSTVWAPATPPDFPNKPVQVIHNHNKDAIEPFLDVDFLASSQGSLSVNGDSWIDPDFPKFYRVEVVGSGAVGVSRYFFRKRPIVGFSGNSYLQPFTFTDWRYTYDGGTSADTPLSPDGFSSINGLNRTNSEASLYHGLSPQHSQFEEYDATTIISWDSLGVVVQDLTDPDRMNYFNATTTPSLPATGIVQTARDNTGNIYVACKNTGLYIISNPLVVLGSPGPSITHITNAANSVPNPGGGGAPRCFGVAKGIGNRVWAVFGGDTGSPPTNTGALSFTEDDGATWTNLNTSSNPIFDDPNIIGDFSTVQYLLVDEGAPTHELGLVIINPDVSSQRRVVWYTTENGGTSTLNARGFKTRYKHVNVSKRGSIWTGTDDEGTTQSRIFVIKFGSSNASDDIILGINDTTNQTGGADQRQNIFFYDYYGTPYPVCTGSIQGFDLTFAGALTNVEGEAFAQFYHSRARTTTSSGDTFAFERDSSGVYLSFNEQRAGSDGSTLILAGPQAWTDDIPHVGAKFTLNHRYSPFEELIWKRYHWNGSGWELNYYTDAVDTAGGSPSLNAARHNFDTEDHFFTGRSMIDASVAFPTGVFTTDATFAFKLTPEDKLDTTTNTLGAKSQEYQQTLFDIADTSTGQHLQVILRDKSDQITIVDDTAVGSPVAARVTTQVGATPSTGANHRVVVTINGTTLTVYVDGVQLGTPVTLANAIDMANTSGTLVYHIGARTYFWEMQRHSTLPGQFYRGIMENVQLWNVEWDSTDVSNDFSNIDGVIISKPTSNLIARYELTQDLTGLETKATHGTVESFDEGMTISFTDGSSGTSFVDTDYFTFGVVDGILKDNAIAWSQEYSMYLGPTEINFSEITNPAEETVVPASPSQVTETACWGRISSFVHSLPGKIGTTTTNNDTITADIDRGGVTAQVITGDGWFEGSANAEWECAVIGITGTPASNINGSNVSHGIVFQRDTTIDIIEGGVITQTGVSTYTLDDVFRITRTGTTVTFEKIDNTGSPAGSLTQIATSAVSSTGSVYGLAMLCGRSSALKNCRINWTQPANVMRYGTSSVKTGAYSDRFFIIDTSLPESLRVNVLGGSPDPLALDVVAPAFDDSWWENLPAPGPGQVVINGRSGHLIFNDNEQGATINGEASLLYYKN